MTFEYKPSAAEKKAEALLRSKGWSVSAPSYATTNSHASRKQAIRNASMARFLGRVLTVADGNVGMRRGE